MGKEDYKNEKKGHGFLCVPKELLFDNRYKQLTIEAILLYLDECGYSFVIMDKGMSSFISDLILENKGTFENKRSCDMNAYGVYGKTVQRTLFEGDEKKRSSIEEHTKIVFAKHQNDAGMLGAFYHFCSLH